jgi:hypothetical protein
MTTQAPNDVFWDVLKGSLENLRGELESLHQPRLITLLLYLAEAVEEKDEAVLEDLIRFLTKVTDDTVADASDIIEYINASRPQPEAATTTSAEPVALLPITRSRIALDINYPPSGSDFTAGDAADEINRALSQLMADYRHELEATTMLPRIGEIAGELAEGRFREFDWVDTVLETAIQALQAYLNHHSYRALLDYVKILKDEATATEATVADSDTPVSEQPTQFYYQGWGGYSPPEELHEEDDEELYDDDEDDEEADDDDDEETETPVTLSERVATFVPEFVRDRRPTRQGGIALAVIVALVFACMVFSLINVARNRGRDPVSPILALTAAAQSAAHSATVTAAWRDQEALATPIFVPLVTPTPEIQIQLESAPMPVAQTGDGRIPDRVLALQGRYVESGYFPISGFYPDMPWNNPVTNIVLIPEDLAGNRTFWHTAERPYLFQPSGNFIGHSLCPPGSRVEITANGRTVNGFVNEIGPKRYDPARTITPRPDAVISTALARELGLYDGSGIPLGPWTGSFTCYGQ